MLPINVINSCTYQNNYENDSSGYGDNDSEVLLKEWLGASISNTVWFKWKKIRYPSYPQTGVFKGLFAHITDSGASVSMTTCFPGSRLSRYLNTATGLLSGPTVQRLNTGSLVELLLMTTLPVKPK